MSRRIEDLHYMLRPICLKHMALFEEEYPELLLVLSFTWRSFREQDELFYLGRDSQGHVRDRSKVVTYARGGQSWHNVIRAESDGKEYPASLAYDLLIYDKARKPLAAKRTEWTKLGKIGMDLGLNWGVIADDNTRWDLGHFYLRGLDLLTLKEANSGLDPRLA